MSSWWRRWLPRGSGAAAPSAAETRLPPGLPPPSAADIDRARGASREALGFVMSELRDERGIHLESLFCALGALAGRACQESVRARARADSQSAQAYFTQSVSVDGQVLYSGAALEQPLAEDRLSLWSLVAGAAAHGGARHLPERREIERHLANALLAGVAGGPFGVPRLPAGHSLQALPLDYARRLWPGTCDVLRETLPEARLWPVALGLAIQELMTQTRAAGRGQLPPDLVVRLVMESAIPAARLPLDELSSSPVSS